MITLDRIAVAVVLGLIAHVVPVAAAGPYPPYPPYPNPQYQQYPQSSPPAQSTYPPPRAIDPNPPPLSPAMRAIYAPFYVTGLVLRYTVYYALVAPFEVLNRAMTYGVEGGVERHPAPPAPSPPQSPSPEGGP